MSEKLWVFTVARFLFFECFFSLRLIFTWQTQIYLHPSKIPAMRFGCTEWVCKNGDVKNVYSEQNVYGVINLFSLGSGCVFGWSMLLLYSHCCCSRLKMCSSLLGNGVFCHSTVKIIHASASELYSVCTLSRHWNLNVSASTLDDDDT